MYDGHVSLFQFCHCSTSAVEVTHREKMSSMNLFHTRGLCGLALRSRSSKSAINMMEKATAIFVPIAIPCVCTKCLLLNLKEFSSKMSRISSLKCVVEHTAHVVYHGVE